jgi:hypothetical protein
VLLLAVGVAACTGVPGITAHYQVTAIVQRGAYLDALVQQKGSSLRFFFPASDACRRVIAIEASVEYKADGPLGRFERGGEVCEPLGVASLAAWRDRGPRGATRPVPRRPANFRVIYEDDDLVMVRGRFPFTGKIGLSGGEDTIALIPRTEACRRIIERGQASLEYRDSGPDPYRLITPEGRCPIEGFVQPLPSA